MTRLYASRRWALDHRSGRPQLDHTYAINIDNTLNREFKFITNSRTKLRSPLNNPQSDIVMAEYVSALWVGLGLKEKWVKVYESSVLLEE